MSDILQAFPLTYGLLAANDYGVSVVDNPVADYLNNLEVLPMQKYIKALQDYCKQNPPNTGNAKSILELLYWHYAELNPVDNKEIRDGFAKIRQQYSHLSMQEFDPIFTTVSDLCEEHEHLAFLKGLRLGITLMTELVEKGN